MRSTTRAYPHFTSIAHAHPDSHPHIDAHIHRYRYTHSDVYTLPHGNGDFYTSYSNRSNGIRRRTRRLGSS